ncbi:MAG: adenylate/guanylate cyclase domain-containing protein [bacterium]|nr:adenylate/guanylate cyclase domain-containing protein [bacterium]
MKEDSCTTTQALYSLYTEVPETLDPQFHRTYRAGSYGWPLALMFHAVFVVLFTVLGIKLLALYNAFSVIVYIINILLHRRSKFNLAVLFCIIEMYAYVIICVYCLGWETGFQFWFFTQTLPLFIAFRLPAWFKGLCTVCTCALFVSLAMFVRPLPPVYTLNSTITVILYYFNAISSILSITAVMFFFNKAAESAEAMLHEEHKKSENLLLNILPQKIAERLKQNTGIIADRFKESSILFADLVGFTELSDKISAEELVEFLNSIFSRFDDLIDEYGLEKIKTIGDAYMIASGLPEEREDHAPPLVKFAREMLTIIDDINTQEHRDIQIRIGINSGPVVAGVIGKKKFVYDMWGDTVNIASRMESHGEPGKIHVSASTYGLVKDLFPVEPRGSITIKGKGLMDTYFIKPEQEK